MRGYRYVEPPKGAPVFQLPGLWFNASEVHALLTMQQMLIGLGLAESTPGPLIMVTQYVGFVGAWHLPGGLAPSTAAVFGGLLTTYVTFLPCFFFIFAGAPFIEAMAGISLGVYW